MLQEQPDAIILTVGKEELEEKGEILFRQAYQKAVEESKGKTHYTLPKGKNLLQWGYRSWLKNFQEAMETDDWSYWYKIGNKPKFNKLLYVYICIGNKIRWRANFVAIYGPMEIEFSNRGKMFGKAWIVCAGPAVKAPVDFPFKGFQGFRYTKKLF